MTLELDISIREVTHTLSHVMEVAGVNHAGHGKRVTLVAAICATGLGWDRARTDRLLRAAMLHDCGEVDLGAGHLRVSPGDGVQDHCRRGAGLLAGCAPLADTATPVRYHHHRWRDLLDEDLDEDDALLANALFLADQADAWSGLSDSRMSCEAAAAGAGRWIAERRGDWFAPELADVFAEHAGHESFWLAQDGDRLERSIDGWLRRGISQAADYQALRSIATLFANIIDIKSRHTGDHSRGVASLATHIAGAMGVSRINRQKLEIAGLLHDIGKLRVPPEILNKQGLLTADERRVIDRHSLDTYLMLSGITGFDEISGWAAQHHDRPGRPCCPLLSRRDHPLESRILAVADIFQALSQARPYRPALSRSRIRRMLRELADDGALDGDVVARVEADFDACWEAAHPDHADA